MTAGEDGGRDGAPARAELARLRAAGAVEKVLLIPAEMGGRDDPGNVAWVPPACAREKHAFDRRVQQQWARGVVVKYAAVPAYEGAARCRRGWTCRPAGRGCGCTR